MKEQCKNSRLPHLLIVMHGETLWSPAQQPMDDDDDNDDGHENAEMQKRNFDDVTLWYPIGLYNIKAGFEISNLRHSMLLLIFRLKHFFRRAYHPHHLKPKNSGRQLEASVLNQYVQTLFIYDSGSGSEVCL